jgi:4-aminobutyrate aminotransferase-like enzyme
MKGLLGLAYKHTCIADVRGLGMMLGVEFETDNGSGEPLSERVAREAFRRGLILLTAGNNTIRWSPPLILTREQAAVALEIFDQAIVAAQIGRGLPDESLPATAPMARIQARGD